MECSNAERNAEGQLNCKATGYGCRYIPSDPKKHYSPCLFDPIFSKCKQLQEMLEAIRTVQVGSEVIVLFKTQNGFYTKTALDSSKGKVLRIDRYGCMEIEVAAWIGTWKFNPEDFTRFLFLSKKESEKKQIELEEQMEEQERMKAERREEKEDE